MPTRLHPAAPAAQPTVVVAPRAVAFPEEKAKDAAADASAALQAKAQEVADYAVVRRGREWGGPCNAWSGRTARRLALLAAARPLSCPASLAYPIP